MNAKLLDKLGKILALTSSPNENEANAAADHLQRLLTEHNLTIADLEKRGAAPKPGVREADFDLGKAAFTWKLNLAEAVAEHYYCAPIVNRQLKTVQFVGRPDNVESLKALYGWLIRQIADIARDARRVHIETTGDHIDPLRWQVNFGLGAVGRLGRRLRDRKDELMRQPAENAETALVLSHAAEISDYMEEKYGYRVDGQPTKEQRAADERWQTYVQAARREEERLEALKRTDIEAYYAERPWERPEEVERKRRQAEKEIKQQEARDRRNAARRTGRKVKEVSPEEQRRQDQEWSARESGRAHADKVNLEPFLTGNKAPKGELR